mmetsp:Transcript_46910/g.69755  ORF Transcript_46910/g.69755 Transcript_46910/m.69755 type:complete len:99 (-) Transcript_46910:1003-1299(-)
MKMITATQTDALSSEMKPLESRPRHVSLGTQLTRIGRPRKERPQKDMKRMQCLHKVLVDRSYAIQRQTTIPFAEACQDRLGKLGGWPGANGGIDFCVE